MKPWVEDAIEQIATAEVLNAAGTSTGERLAYIVCDNSVEFMMIAYTEMQTNLVGTKITKKEWETAKNQFPSLLNHTVSHVSGMNKHQSDINSNHKTRNDLYHSGKPLSVKAAHVSKYLDIAKEVVELLFGEKLLPDNWAKHAAAVSAKIEGSGGKKIKAIVTITTPEADVVQVETNRDLTDHDRICTVLDSYMTKIGHEPNLDQLERSLVRSHASHLRGTNLSKRLYDCRKRGLIQKDGLGLTAKGSQHVLKKVVLTAN